MNTELGQFKRELEEEMAEMRESLSRFADYSSISREEEAALKTRILSSIIVSKVTINISTANAQNSSTTTVKVYGASVGDAVVLTPPSAAIVGNLGSLFIAYVSAADTVTIKFVNPDTGSSLDPGSGEFTIVIIKP